MEATSDYAYYAGWNVMQTMNAIVRTTELKKDFQTALDALNTLAVNPNVDNTLALHVRETMRSLRTNISNASSDVNKYENHLAYITNFDPEA